MELKPSQWQRSQAWAYDNNETEAQRNLAGVCRLLLTDPCPSITGKHRLEIAPGYVNGKVPYLKPSGPPELVPVSLTDLDTGEERVEWRPCPRRGKITEFSRPARRRMLKRLASFVAIPDLFDTVTFPGDWSLWPDPEEWKRLLDVLGKRLARRYPLAYAEWKMEPQERGAPHFHFLIWLGFRPTDEWHERHKAWLAQAWAEIVNHPDAFEYEKHLKHGSFSEIVEGGRNAVMAYVSKYVGKPITGGLAFQWKNPGRWYGCIGTKNKPMTSRLDVVLSDSEYVAFRRLARHWVRAQQYRPHLQGDNPKTVKARIRQAKSGKRYSRRLARFDSLLLFMPESTALQLAQAATGSMVPGTLTLTDSLGGLSGTAGLWDWGTCVDAFDRLAALPPAWG